jgi:hypothetical protein
LSCRWIDDLHPQIEDPTWACIHIPACRHHHHTKQIPGWTVTSDQPGTLTWTTPGHRSHTTTPAQYCE